MKNLIIILVTITTLLSCEKSEEIEKYDITFWSNNEEGEIVVTFDNTSTNSQLGLVTVPNEIEPACGSEGSANFKYPQGTYSWEAVTSSDNYTWSGIEVISVEPCLLIKLEHPGHSSEELQQTAMTKTWTLRNVILGSELISDLTGLTVTVDANFNYTTNSTTLGRQPNPWPASGTFAFVENSDGTANINQVIRDGELIMTVVVSANGAEMELHFDFDDGEHFGSEKEGDDVVDGDWFFIFR